jgi:hypothetical protein
VDSVIIIFKIWNQDIVAMCIMGCGKKKFRNTPLVNNPVCTVAAINLETPRLFYCKLFVTLTMLLTSQFRLRQSVDCAQRWQFDMHERIFWQTISWEKFKWEIQINVILCLKIGFSVNFYAVVDGHDICTELVPGAWF